MRIAARNFLNYLPFGIHHTLFLRSSSVPLLGKTISTDTRGLLFLHWFNEGCCVKGGKIGEEVRSM